MQWLDNIYRFRRPAAEPSWAWAAANVDYSRVPNYDTPYRGPFDPDLMPFWREPLEAARDPDVREIAVLKCSRAGMSENLFLTDARYTIARAPELMLYVTGKMELALGFLERRLKRGMDLAPELRRKFRQAQCVGEEIRFDDMDFRATWASSDSATKQDGWARIHADEVSLWGEFTVDMVRRRCAAYPFHHILFGGSIDPTRRGNPMEDPMLKLYLESDQRVWMMPDPGGAGQWFAWGLAGIKWPDAEKEYDSAADCDLEAIAAGAWYETPAGARIDEAARMDVTRAGRWEVRNPNGIRRGYKVTAPMVPFADCTFGELAKRFLSAKHRMDLAAKKGVRDRNTLRTYFAEMWGEAHHEEELVARDTSLAVREADYAMGGLYVPSGWKHTVIFTVDVQKYHYWWLARCWAYKEDGEPGVCETGLIDFGTAASIADLDVIAGDAKPDWIGIDIGYALKATEVGAYCAQYTNQNRVDEAHVIALRGSDKLQKMPIDRQIRDAYEGGRSAGRALFYELTFNADVYRTQLLDAMNGDGVPWWVPAKRDNEARYRSQYVRQVTSTRKVDGEWLAVGYREDHLWDCEVMQFVIASCLGLVK